MSANEQLDKIFFSLISDLTNEVKDLASSSAEDVLALASEYLEEDESTAFFDFYNMYFSDNAKIAKSESLINSDVDSIMQEAQEALEAGKDLKELYKEDEVAEGSLVDSRLGVAAFQKDLESLVRMEDGIKSNLLPVLTSMQFEDQLSQRLSNIERAWDLVIQGWGSGNDLNIDNIKDEMKGGFRCPRERTLFYQIVLGEEPPKDIEEADMDMLFDLFDD